MWRLTTRQDPLNKNTGSAKTIDDSHESKLNKGYAIIKHSYKDKPGLMDEIYMHYT